jgi:hypothetical protein
MIPISDEKAFLDLLANVNFPAKKGANDVYTIEPNGPLPVPLDFRFANGYAYVTAINVDAISKANLIAPATAFPAGQTALASATVRLDRIPDVAKQIALQQIDDALAKEKEKRPPQETEKQRALREKTLDALAAGAAAVIREGKELDAQLNLDEASKQLTAALALTAKSGSKLAAGFDELGKSKSLFGAWMGGENAMSALVHVAVPKELREAFTAAVEEGVKQGLAKEKDEAKRAQAKQFLKSLEPTLRAGELDAALALRGSEGKKYTMLVGVKLKDAAEVQKTVRELLKELPPGERAAIKLDAQTVGGMKVHEVHAQSKYDAKTREAFGDNPIYVAFRPDAVLVVLGENGLAAMKTAVAGEAAVTAPAQFQMALGRLVPSFAKTDEQKAAFRKVFGPDTPGQIRAAVEGGPALRLRFSADLSVVEFMGLYFTLRQGQQP